jgi:hypothetical protein
MEVEEQADVIHLLQEQQQEQLTQVEVEEVEFIVVYLQHQEQLGVQESLL